MKERSVRKKKRMEERGWQDEKKKIMSEFIEGLKDEQNR